MNTFGSLRNVRAQSYYDLDRMVLTPRGVRFGIPLVAELAFRLLCGRHMGSRAKQELSPEELARLLQVG